jgi:hypothetical protein
MFSLLGAWLQLITTGISYFFRKPSLLSSCPMLNSLVNKKTHDTLISFR